MKFLLCCWIVLFLNPVEKVCGQNQVCSWTGGSLDSTIASQIKQEGCNIIDGNIDVSSAMTSFADLISVTNITGYLQMNENDLIQNLDGLDNLIGIGISLLIRRCDSLQNLNALSSLRYVLILAIYYNPLLQNLNGLDNLIETGAWLEIQGCNSLKNVDALQSLKSIGDYLHLIDLPSLENIEGLYNLEHTRGFRLTGSKVKTLGTVLSRVNTIPRQFVIWDNTHLENLGEIPVTSFGSYVSIKNNPLLTNLDTFSSLKTVGSYILVQNNTLLKNIYGLANIESIGRVATIFDQNSAFDCNSACNQKILSQIRNVVEGTFSTDCSIDSEISNICNNNDYTNSVDDQICSNSDCYYCTDFNCDVAKNYCGDDIVTSNLGEECDQNNGDSFNCEYGQLNCTFCNLQCLIQQGNISYCGDRIIQQNEGEECDDNIVDSSNCEYGQLNCTFCNLQCLIQQGNTFYCGDDIVQQNEGEECDDDIVDSSNCEYGQLNCTFCNLQCLTQQGNVSYCGDGIIQQNEGEQCDNLTKNCKNCRTVIQTTTLDTETTSKETSNNTETTSNQDPTSNVDTTTSEEIDSTLETSSSVSSFESTKTSQKTSKIIQNSSSNTIQPIIISYLTVLYITFTQMFSYKSLFLD